jgi:hypothetical protein
MWEADVRQFERGRGSVGQEQVGPEADPFPDGPGQDRRRPAGEPGDPRTPVASADPT